MAPTLFWNTIFAIITIFSVGASSVRGESHTIKFDNRCGRGTPLLIQGAKTLSKGEDFTSNGPFSSAIAYLQTGECDFNGEKCATVEMTLGNPTCPGCGSSVDISLIAPHALNVPTAFSYYGGCDGQGATCSTPDCRTAFFKPDDNQVQVACQNDNVNLLITFCPDGPANTPAKPSQPAPPPSSHPIATATAVHVSPPKPEPPVVGGNNVAASKPVDSPAPTPVANAAATPEPTANTSHAPSCRRSSRQSRREVRRDAFTSQRVQLESRALYDARIRAIAGHARAASSRRSFAGLVKA
ncbi:hypothetical protein BXZ70DRAFT_1012083 [Cristinia sonorae]|uniref:Glycopeptide n=1 Tax=Cristinia sonorae TaxID=1940300 RepID=A0A8K0XKV2_9AGAR|nr:hypothetical protein BXZ70DRAFT_1012083 [Cristinia sonorae]